jgi:hypothetical protein
MTNRNRRHVTGTSLCHYCRSDLFPHGKIIDHSTDKLARRTSKGDWICGVCVTEMNNKIVDGMNRRRGIFQHG